MQTDLAAAREKQIELEEALIEEKNKRLELETQLKAFYRYGSTRNLRKLSHSVSEHRLPSGLESVDPDPGASRTRNSVKKKVVQIKVSPPPPDDVGQRQDIDDMKVSALSADGGCCILCDFVLHSLYDTFWNQEGRSTSKSNASAAEATPEPPSIEKAVSSSPPKSAAALIGAAFAKKAAATASPISNLSLTPKTPGAATGPDMSKYRFVHKLRFL